MNQIETGQEVCAGTTTFQYNYGRPPEIEGMAVPPNYQQNTIRNISIKQLNYGYIVEVGCHSFAIETHHKVMIHLGKYLADPKKTEEEWFEKKTLNP